MGHRPDSSTPLQPSPLDDLARAVSGQIVGLLCALEQQRLLAGEVLFHSPDRDEVDRKLLELRPRRFAFRYLGPLPEDVALIL